MRQPWRAAPIWKGLPTVIVAGGESLTLAQVRLIGMARAQDKIRVIAINDAVYPCWFADIAYAADAKWWKFHRVVPGFPGLRVGIEQSTCDKPGLPDGIEYFRNGGEGGFDRDPSTIRTGQNSGHQAVHVAAHLGSPHIVLVAFDMIGAHWFGDHPREISLGDVNHKLRVGLFSTLVDNLKVINITVVNASIKTQLKCVKQVDLAKELRRLGADV